MTPLVYTVPQVVEMLGGKEIVTAYWVNKTARKHKIGTCLRRKLVFTLPQVEQLIAAQALEASQPKPQKQQPTKESRAPKSKLPPATGGTVTQLQSRPERARSYGSAS